MIYYLAGLSFFFLLAALRNIFRSLPFLLILLGWSFIFSFLSWSLYFVIFSRGFLNLGWSSSVTLSILDEVLHFFHIGIIFNILVFLVIVVPSSRVPIPVEVDAVTANKVDRAFTLEQAQL